VRRGRRPRASVNRRTPTGTALLVATLALLVWPVTGAGAERVAGRAQAVRIVFTGKGGGRYLDHTRWLREDTRLCYARRIADEDLAVRWRIAWTARLVRTGGGYALGTPTRQEASIVGSVDGTSVRDTCDSADEEPGWSGSSVCQTPLAARSDGALSASRRGATVRLALRGPVFASPGSPCELDIRNDQLVATATLDPKVLARLAAGKQVTQPLGTRHPAAGVAYRATRSCSLFPHIYDGVVYLYECDDTLIWSGSLTIAPA
jgi:hypothetical protein